MKNLIFYTLSVLFFTNCNSEKTISKNNLKSVWEINYVKSKVELDSTRFRPTTKRVFTSSTNEGNPKPTW